MKTVLVTGAAGGIGSAMARLFAQEGAAVVVNDVSKSAAQHLCAEIRDAGGRAVTVPIYDPATGTGTFAAPRSTLQFPNNVIPASRLDPVAVKYLSYMPAPNRTPDNPFNQTGNFRQNALGTIIQNYWIGRVDHELRASTKLFGRYILSRPRTNQGGGLDAMGPLMPGERSEDRLQNYGLGVTHIFSPTFFVNFTAGVERLMRCLERGAHVRRAVFDHLERFHAGQEAWEAAATAGAELSRLQAEETARRERKVRVAAITTAAT